LVIRSRAFRKAMPLLASGPFGLFCTTGI
jgi:hypothetical protein